MTVSAEVTIEPGSGRFAPDDRAWLDQIANLHAALREEAGTVVRRGVPGPGYKGVSEAVILAVGSSGAVTAAVACFKAWLARDKTRTLNVTWTDVSGTEQHVRLTGDNIDLASLQAVAEGIGSRLGNE